MKQVATSGMDEAVGNAMKRKVRMRFGMLVLDYGFDRSFGTAANVENTE